VLSTRKLTLVIIALLLLSVALTACGGEGATATSPAAQALLDSAKAKDAKEVAARAAVTAAAAAATELNVAAAFYSPDDLAAMTQATAATEDGDVKGTSLLAVLEAAGLASMETVTLTAGDGYSADVAVAEIDDTAVIAVEDGKFNVVIPTVDKSAWVDGVISIAAK
jgi:predicted small lipoprotein YifL